MTCNISKAAKQTTQEQGGSLLVDVSPALEEEEEGSANTDTFKVCVYANQDGDAKSATEQQC